MAEAAKTETIATGAAADTSAAPAPYVDWHAIIAGAVLAAAIALVLITFGSALGLSLTSPFEGEGISAMGFVVAVGLWFVWVQVSSFMAGGYLAGRMRRRLWNATEHEVEVRDGTHGLVVWAVGMIFGALLAASTTVGAIRTAADAAGTVASTAAEAAADVGSGAMTAGLGEDLQRQIDALLRPAPDSTSAQADENAALRDEIGRLLSQILDDDGISDEDKSYLARVVARHTGLDQDTARIRVDRIIAETGAAMETATEEAKQAAETARTSAIIAAFVTAATMLIAAAAAWWAAGVGGRHRDEGIVLRQLAMWR